MKNYKSLLVAAVMILFCFGLSAGLGNIHVYGDSNHHDHGNHNNRGDHGDMQDGMGKTMIRGVVSSISGSTISTLNTDIDASTAEVLLKDCNTSLSVDDIVAGDIIEAKGTVSDGSFVAHTIKLEGAGKLEGTVEAVGTNTVTLLGKVIDTTSAYCVKGKPTVGKKVMIYVRNSDAGLTAIAVKAKGRGMMEME